MPPRARRRKTRNFRKYVRGQVDETLAISTLGSGALVGANFDESPIEQTFISSIVATWSITNWTRIAENGPLTVGVAMSDYSDAEVEEVIEATKSWDIGDLIAQEVSKRKVKIVGTFANVEALVTAIGTQWLNQGRLIKTKLNWLLPTGKTLKLWAYNEGTAAFATTSPTVHVSGHANLWPR